MPIEWLAEFLQVIHECQNLDFLLLTKRPENFENRAGGALAYVRYWLRHENHKDWCDFVSQWGLGNPPSNVWFGVSVEDQKRADERIPELLKIPARVRFVSCEPLLGPIEFGAVPGGLVSPIYQDRRCKIDWVIVGGESGPKARLCNIEWIRSIVQQCKAASVPCFVKQDSGPKSGLQGRIPNDLWEIKEIPNAR